MLPADDYRERLKDRQERVKRYERIHVRLGNARLALAAVAAILAWESLWRHAFSGWWIALPIVAFIFLAAYHSSVLRAQELAARAVSFYERGLARIEERWTGTGQTGERFLDPHHEYAADLDLFGRGGLFELLSTARTRMGEETLAAWLLSPSPVDQLTVRQKSVHALRDTVDFWEDIAVLGKDAEAGVHPDALVNWAEAANVFKATWLPWAGLVLAAGALAGAIAWGYWGLATPFIITIIIAGIIVYSLRKPVEEVLHGSEHEFRDLKLLAGVLASIEKQTFSDPHLLALQRELCPGEVKAAEAIARLSRIINWSEQRENFFFKLLDIPLMYSVQVAYAAERWRAAYGHSVGSWLRVIGEVEALISLATYSHEHPVDPFPEFVKSAGACFEGDALGHPLLADSKCVRNSVSLCETTRVLLVSGSNMSGKSTLLRAIGINTVLAMAGAPVRAKQLRLTPLHVGASIRINDSLQDGSSRFYAEIKRIRRIFDLAGNAVPLLFLLDELLQGTNSRDRLVGAEGVIAALLDRGAIGLVSTHDLALTEMGGRIGGRLHNVHFEEEFREGRMYFDYKLREGIVTKSNGIALMRSIGLDV